MPPWGRDLSHLRSHHNSKNEAINRRNRHHISRALPRHLQKTTVHATHQTLADELGSVPEIVSRLLKNFADQGWIKLGREQIESIDATALKKFCSL